MDLDFNKLDDISAQEAASRLSHLLQLELKRTDRVIRRHQSEFRQTLFESRGFTVSMRKEVPTVVYKGGRSRKATPEEVVLYKELKRLSDSTDKLIVEASKRRWSTTATMLSIDLLRSWSVAYHASRRIALAFGSHNPIADPIKRLRMVERWYSAVSRCAAVARQARNALGIRPMKELNSIKKRKMDVSNARDPYRVDWDQEDEDYDNAD